MSRASIIGPSYTSQSQNVDCQRTVNWMVEQVESGVGKSAFCLIPCPGLQVFCVLTDTPVRGEVFYNGRFFAVAGATLFEVFADGSKQQRGAVINDGNTAYLVCGPQHLLVASGGHAYVMVLATNVVTDLTQANTLPNISMVTWNDSFFLALQSQVASGQNSVFASNAGDATTWNALAFETPNVFPDQVLAIATDHRETVFLGPRFGQFFYNAGDSPFPLDVDPSGYLETGISDPATLTKIDNTLLFIATDDRGERYACRINGNTPTRISTHAIEYAWSLYPNDGSAVSYTFRYNGHLIWQTYFPNANGGNGATWCYDVTAGATGGGNGWFERDHFTNGVSKAHQSRCHANAFGKHLVGAWDSGTIYQMAEPQFVVNGPNAAWTFCDDAGNPIRFLRRSTIISKELERMSLDRLIVDGEVGIGPIPPLLDGAGNARDPQMMVRWSNNAAKTWSNINTVNFGQAGNYEVRPMVSRLGSFRQRVFELTATDPIRWVLADVYLTNESDYTPTERLPKDLAKRA